MPKITKFIYFSQTILNGLAYLEQFVYDKTATGFRAKLDLIEIRVNGQFLILLNGLTRKERKPVGISVSIGI